MRRTVILAVMLVMALAANAEAQAYDCLLRNSCAPPPCEFFEALTFAKAEVRSIARVRATQRAVTSNAWKGFMNVLMKQMDGARRQYSRCASLGTIPTINPSDPPSCSLPDLKAALNASRTCSETVEAHYAEALVTQGICRANPKQMSPSTFAELRALWLVTAQARVNSLEAKLQGYLASCVPTILGEASKSGLSTLATAGLNAQAGARARRAAVGASAP